jgi:hypothetical protein
MVEVWSKITKCFLHYWTGFWCPTMLSFYSHFKARIFKLLRSAMRFQGITIYSSWYVQARIWYIINHTVFKEKHGVWYPMPKFTITSSYLVNTCTMGNPRPESTLFPSQGLGIRPLFPIGQLCLRASFYQWRPLPIGSECPVVTY